MPKRNLTPNEKRLGVALIAAVVATEPRNSLVRERQEDLLSSTCARWIHVSAEKLTQIYELLGGVVSAGRHLGVHPSTLHAWRRRGRMPTKKFVEATRLIASEVKPLVRDRHAHRNNK